MRARAKRVQMRQCGRALLGGPRLGAPLVGRGAFASPLGSLFRCVRGQRPGAPCGGRALRGPLPGCLPFGQSPRGRPRAGGLPCGLWPRPCPLGPARPSRGGVGPPPPGLVGPGGVPPPRRRCWRRAGVVPPGGAGGGLAGPRGPLAGPPPSPAGGPRGPPVPPASACPLGLRPSRPLGRAASGPAPLGVLRFLFVSSAVPAAVLAVFCGSSAGVYAGSCGCLLRPFPVVGACPRISSSLGSVCSVLPPGLFVWRVHCGDAGWGPGPLPRARAGAPPPRPGGLPLCGPVAFGAGFGHSGCGRWPRVFLGWRAPRPRPLAGLRPAGSALLRRPLRPPLGAAAAGSGARSRVVRLRSAALFFQPHAFCAPLGPPPTHAVCFIAAGLPNRPRPLAARRARTPQRFGTFRRDDNATQGIE